MNPRTNERIPTAGLVRNCYRAIGGVSYGARGLSSPNITTQRCKIWSVYALAGLHLYWQYVYIQPIAYIHFYLVTRLSNLHPERESCVLKYKNAIRFLGTNCLCKVIKLQLQITTQVIESHHRPQTTIPCHYRLTLHAGHELATQTSRPNSTYA